MKQKLRLIMLVLLCALTGNAMSETITFADLGYENADDVTIVEGTNVTLTFDKGTGTNAPKYYASGAAVRMYKGNTLTVSSDKEISSVVFTCVNNYGLTEGNYEFSDGSFSDGTWTGSTNEFVLTNTTTGSQQIRIVEMTINYSDGTTDKLNPGLKVNSVTLKEGTTQALEVTTQSNGALTFTPEDASIASVTQSGSTYTVHALAVGTTSVKVSQAETSTYKSAQTTFSVTVTANIAPGEYATVQMPYTVDFTKTQDQFVIEDKVNPDGLTIWKQGSTYGMTATAYVDNTNHESESWLVSPIVDLSGVSKASLTFSDNWNKFFTDYDNDFGVYVREKNGSWSKLAITYEKPSSSYNGWVDREFDLANFVGKTLQVGFKYTSTTTSAGTYEVKNFSVVEGAAQQDAGISFGTANFTAWIGQSNDFPVLQNPNNLAVTYTSNNEAVATVAADGTVTLVAEGQTTIKAVSEETEQFKAGEASYLLVVKEKAVQGTDVYELVTDASTLAADDQIIIVNEEKTYALSTTQNNNNRAATDATEESDGTIIVTDKMQVITLEGDATAWDLNVGNGYLYAASTSSNHLKTQEAASEKSHATITIDENGLATVLFNQWDPEGKARNLMKYNYNNGNPIFSCYTESSTSGTLVRIYRNNNAAPPKPAAGLAWSEETCTAKYGADNNVYPTLSNPNNLAVTYKSSDEAVATINASGVITLVDEGTTTITASSEETPQFKAGSASYTLIVERDLEDNGITYTLVTDASTLAAGDIIVIVGENTVAGDPEQGTSDQTTLYALSTVQNNNNRSGITVNGNSKTVNGNTKVQEITLEGEEGGWKLNVGNGYLYAASSTANYMRTTTEPTADAEADITIDDSGTLIVFQGENQRNDLRFNYNKGNPIFSCYGSNTTMTQVKIYRKADASILLGDANGDGEVNVIDAMLVVNYVITTGKADLIEKNADVDGNGNIDIVDVMAIVNIALTQ